MSYEGRRPHMEAWASKRVRTGGTEAIRDYQREKNAESLDGLPAVELADDSAVEAEPETVQQPQPQPAPALPAVRGREPVARQLDHAPSAAARAGTAAAACARSAARVASVRRPASRSSATRAPKRLAPIPSPVCPAA